MANLKKAHSVFLRIPSIVIIYPEIKELAASSVFSIIFRIINETKLGNPKKHTVHRRIPPSFSGFLDLCATYVGVYI